MSSLVPSVLGFIQGIGSDNGCTNQTNILPAHNFSSEIIEQTLVDHRTSPRFSVQVFFFIISFVIVLSIVDFAVLNFTKYAKREYKKSANLDINDKDSVDISHRVLTPKEKFEKIALIVIVFLVNFFYYGVMPGLQSYATLPYSDQTYFMSVNLSKSICLKSLPD